MKIKIVVIFLLPVFLLQPFSDFPTTKQFIYTGTTSDRDSNIPVLSYNAINNKPVKSSVNTISEEDFKKHLITLHEQGYQTVLPEQIYQFMIHGKAIPGKSVMLSFDDAYVEDYNIAFPILNILGFKAVFFVNTVAIGKPGFMSASQIKELADSGHVIGGHTWNHSNIEKLRDRDLIWQIEKPKQEIEKITGKAVYDFAYPYGVWNNAGISKLKTVGVKTAFQLSGKQSEKYPLHTIRRLAVSGLWSAADLLAQMDSTFNMD